MCELQAPKTNLRRVPVLSHTSICFLRLLAVILLGANCLDAQSTCGNAALTLTPDYQFAVGTSSGGGAYTWALNAQTIAQGTSPQLGLFHYDNSLASTSGTAPLKATGTSFVQGKWGSALAVATGGNLSYPAVGHVSFTDGTIELWIAATKDGTDPIYSKYDHTLFRYTAANGDQLVVAESASAGIFYVGTIINKTFTGVGGIQMASLKAGVWHHLAFTYSKTNGRFGIYLDGTLVYGNVTAFSMPAADGPSFTIDSDPYGNASAFLVDDLRISSSEETAAQIQYDATRSTPFADNEVLLQMTGVPAGQLSYAIIGCGSASYAWTGIPITNLTPGSNLLAPGTTSLALSFNTLQPSSCAYSLGSRLPFASMQVMTGGQKTTSHQGTIRGLSSSPLDLNTVYLQCDSNPDFVQTLQYRVVGARNGTFPRIASWIQGEYILVNTPAQAAKRQVHFGPIGMTPSQALTLRAQNHEMLILPTASALDSAGTAAIPDGYLLKDVNGNTIEDWPGNFLLNLTKPEVAAFVAQQAFETYLVNSNFAFDGIFWDSFLTSIPNVYYDYKNVAHKIDADGDGVQDDQASLSAAWRKGVYSLIGNFDALAPSAYVAGHIGISPPPQSALLGFHGDSFVFKAVDVREGAYSFDNLFSDYNTWCANGRQPSVATVQSSPPSQIAYGYGFQPLQNMLPATLQFAQSYYPNMRFGLALALMNDGFFFHDFGDIVPPVSWWYDEFDVNLGYPIGPAARIGSGNATNLLKNGGFESSLAGTWQLGITNDGQAEATAALDSAIAADGGSSAHVTIASAGTVIYHISFEQGNLPIVAGTNYQVQFWARADSPRTITVFSQGVAPSYPNYGLTAQIAIDTTWRLYSAVFVATATANDARLGFWVGDVAGNVWFDDVQLSPSPQDTYRRDYTNGPVLLNGTASTQTIPVESGLRKFSGTQAPLWQNIVDDDAADFIADSSWQTVTYDTGLTDYNGFGATPGSPNPPFYHAWNRTTHQQASGTSTAQWKLNVPADGQYTIQVWLPAAPGANGWTKSAAYEVVSNGAVIATSTLDQTSATAGDAWHTIATVNLTSAGAPVLRVHNTGSGPVVADAVYVTSAALFNDGSVVSQVTLGPYDGILLQRQQPLAVPSSRVSAVVNAANFQPAIASGGFVSIMGTGFASSARSWAGPDFKGSDLPQSLDGVSVTINGKPAYVEYISPTQINAIAPDDDTIGQVPVQVTTPQGPSYSGTALKQKASPGFFAYQSGGTTYAAAVHVDGTLVGPSGPGSRPAAPGEVIEVYGTGFGPTNPATPSAQLVSQPALLASPAAVSIGGVDAEVQWAGLVSSGLYQLNVKIPDVTAGDQQVQTSVSGFLGASNVYIPIAGN